MKRLMTAIYLIVCIGTIRAADLGSYEFINCLLNLSGPASPVIFEDSVIFTAPSSYRRVGISFAYEGFSKVYWMQKLVLPRDPIDIANDGKKRNLEMYYDSGMLFHVQQVPDGIPDVDYRMIIEGLWTADPLNPVVVSGSGGILLSRVKIPARTRPVPTVDSNSRTLHFSFMAPPGETITVGGSFNNWDPFMYEMKETRTGFYTLTLNLPPGTYQYVFYYRGEKYPDPNNNNRVYTKDGKTASQALLRQAYD